VQITIIPGPGVCNLDNIFYLYFTATCRNGYTACPGVFDSSANVTALIRSESWCPKISFDFPIFGNITTWTALFFAPETNYIVYTHPVVSASAQLLCVKGTISFPGQVQSGETILDTFFWSLAIADDFGNSVYLLQNGDQECPTFTHGECTNADEIDLTIDTEANNNQFGLGPDTAGACFYLTITGNPNTDPNTEAQGLLDSLQVNPSQSPVQIHIEAVIGVNFQGAKKMVSVSKSVPTPGSTTYAETTINVEWPNSQITHGNSATSLYVNIFTIVFALVIAFI